MEHPTAAETAANAATDIAPPTGWAAVKQKIVACFWEVEEHLADIFGLNDSKYQFAIDEYMQKKQEEEEKKSSLTIKSYFFLMLILCKIRDFVFHHICKFVVFLWTIW